MDGRRHFAECAQRCVDGCDVYEFQILLSRPVLPAEIVAERVQEERLKALAAALNGGGRAE